MEPLKLVKISEPVCVGPYLPPKIKHYVTKFKYGKISSHFLVFKPYFTIQMTTDFDEIIHVASHVSWQPTKQCF